MNTLTGIYIPNGKGCQAIGILAVFFFFTSCFAFALPRTGAADTVDIHPSGLASNSGWSITGDWATALDNNDGDTTRASNSGNSQDTFYVDMDNPSLTGCTINSITIYFVARYSGSSTSARAGFSTDNRSTEKWDVNKTLTSSYQTYTTQTWTVDSADGALDPTDIDNLLVAIQRTETGGSREARVTEVYATIDYTPSNHAPTLAWTGDAGFVSDGVNPDSDVSGSTFEFRVEYTDQDNDAPTIKEVWVDLDDSGTYESGEKYDMTLLSGSDYTLGVDYNKSMTIDYAGDGTINYRFYFHDGTDPATGTPSTDHALTVTNNAPTLNWTGDTGFVSDGVNPDSDVSGSTFEFRVEYTDGDNHSPHIKQVWVDIDDNGGYGADEKFTMDEVDLGDTDYTDGKDYTYSAAITYSGDGTINYRFYFHDGTDPSSGDPTTDRIFTVTVGANAPTLNWTGDAGYTTDGVEPNTGDSGDTFEFRVMYTDVDNDPPSVEQVWVDLDDSGTYEADEKFDMTSLGGMDYTAGVDYTKSMNIYYAGDGTLKYKFYFSDGLYDATGEPTSDHTFIVAVGENAPTLDWTEDPGFVSDGIELNSAVSGSTFEFRVEYSDQDNDAPTIKEVWVDLDDSGTYESGEKFDMRDMDQGDTDYTNGKDYAKSITIYHPGGSSTDEDLIYKFYFGDGFYYATGDPASDSTFTVEAGGGSIHHVSKTGNGAAPYDTWAEAATSIQTAVNYASGHSTVIVAVGTYSETVTMKDGVHVINKIGDKPTISRSGSGRQEVVTFSGSMTCNLRGFEITSTGKGAGIFMNGSGAGITSTIENCDIHNNYYGAGIRLNGVISPTITGCNIYSNDEAGIATAVTRGDQLTSGSSITIKGNTIGGSGQGNEKAGIYLDGSGSGIQITIGGSSAGDGNTISYNTEAGIRLEDIDQVSMQNNDISNNSEAGILLIDASTVSPHIKNNDIHDHAGEAGINIGGSSNVTIGDNNDIYSNHAGVVFYVSTNNRVAGSASSQPVTIRGNNIYNNSYAGIGIKDPITNTLDTTITQNDIYLNGADGGGGIGIQNQCKLVITKNKIRDNVRGGIHTGTAAADGGGFSGSMGSAVLTIRQNKVYNNGGSDHGAGIDVRHASGTIYNNLVYRNKKAGIRFGWQVAADPHITDIINNTVVNNGQNGAGGGIIYDDLTGDVNDPPSGSLPGKLNIRNNVCAYNEKAGIRACFDNSLEERDYNFLYDNNNCGHLCSGRYMAKQLGATGCDYDSAGVGATNDIFCYEPLFVDKDNNDYHLQSDSPAVDAGDTSYGDDLSIPPGVGTLTIDMGAYGGPDGINW